MKSFLIVGLGNIGLDYDNTRHNIGFNIVNALAKKKEANFETVRLGELASFNIKGKIVHILKPNTFMNCSGKAIRYWIGQKKIPLQNLMVITDDINLDFGTIRIRPKGSAGGHNGLQDICNKLNTNSYSRLRFGIGSEFGKGKQVDFVLQLFSKEEVQATPLIINKSVDAIISFICEGILSSMNTYNGNLLDNL